VATRALLLMACPDATLLKLSSIGREPAYSRVTDYCKSLREFFPASEGVMEVAIGSRAVPQVR
jgi:predicted ATPase